MKKATINMFMAKLSGACFDSLDMPHTNFGKVLMSESRIVDSALEGSDFSLSKINLSDIVNSSLVNSNFEGAVLNSTRLESVDFTGANLKNCEWINCYSDKCIFTDAITDGFIINGRAFNVDDDLEKERENERNGTC